MRRAVWLFVMFALGCVAERSVAIEIVPPRAPGGGPDVPADVVRWELRLERLEGDASCPSAEDAAAARPTGRLAHVQSFEHASGMGGAIGEVPSGRWALAAIARTDACAVRLYGCAEVVVDGDVPDAVVVAVSPHDSGESCGCRTCEGGACTPESTVCE